MGRAPPSVPLRPRAGAVRWGALGASGYLARSTGWRVFGALVTGGAIFPLALLLARLLRADFMRERTAVSVALGIGTAIRWPVIGGWTYARTGLLTAHAVVRALACIAIWPWLPAHRYARTASAVRAVYLGTVLAILVDASGAGGHVAPAAAA